jgi:DNA-binding NtrC family response regulator
MHSRRSLKFHTKAGLVSFCNDSKFKPSGDRNQAGGNGRKQGMILVIDDERVVRTINSRIAGKIGYNAITAKNGEKGVELYRENQGEIALVICDFIMPGMNGLEVLIALQEINPDVKVIIASGFTDTVDPNFLLEAGAKKFIQKPFGISEMRKAVEEVVG